MEVDTVVADYADAQHADDLVYLLDAYARDPMGAGEPLSESVKRDLVPALAAQAHAVSLLCYVDQRPAGVVNCFEGLSTFRCRKLLNIHDLAVHPDFRGLGLSQHMLRAAEALAISRGCAKLTLEVLEGNERARAAYKKFGFDSYQLDPALGRALFLEKSISPETD